MNPTAMASVSRLDRTKRSSRSDANRWLCTPAWTDVSRRRSRHSSNPFTIECAVLMQVRPDAPPESVRATPTPAPRLGLAARVGREEAADRIERRRASMRFAVGNESAEQCRDG